MDSLERKSIIEGKHLLKVIISHARGSHDQSMDDLVKAVYKPPVSSYKELCLISHEEVEEAIIIEEGADINELQKSVVSEYRKKTGFYNPLKISQVRLKVANSGEEDEVLKVKVVQVISNSDEMLEGIFDSNVDTHCLDRFPVHTLPSCELAPDRESTVNLKLGEKEESGGILIETYCDSNREMFSVNFAEGDVLNVSKSVIDKFRKISGISESLSARRERIFTCVNEKEIPVTILYMFSDPDLKILGTSIPAKETVPKRGQPRGRRKGKEKVQMMEDARQLNEYVTQFKHSKFRRTNSNSNQDNDIQVTLEDEISDMEEDNISSFGCETGIVVGGIIASSADGSNCDGPVKENLPMFELQSSHEDMNASLNPRDIWKFLTQYASEDSRVQGLVTQFNNESWLQVKRMSNFYQVDGEVMTDLSFKVVYKNDFSPVTYFLRGFSRLLKTGELSTANDINNLFRFMSRDRKLCLGLKPSPYTHIIDSNNQVRQFFQDKGQFVSTPFECLLSKSCRGIVKISGSTPFSMFTRGAKTVQGIHALCRACAFLGKKMNQLIKLPPTNGVMEVGEMHEKVVGDSFHHLLKQPVERTGMTYSALKYLFTQSVPEILSDKEQRSKQTVPEDKYFDEDEQVGRKSDRLITNKKEGTSKSSISVSEKAFLQMIDLQPPNSEGLGRSLLKKCNLCQFRAPTMLSLITHMKGHLGTLKEKCSQCEIHLSSKEAIEIHKKQMHSERSPICSICEMDFTTNDQLFDHMNKHRNHLPFKCPYCNHKLSNKEAYKKHLRLTHKITSVKDLKFNCKTCNIFFYTQDHVLLHRINQNHEGIEPFNCRACVFSCVTANEFRHHIMEHAEEEREAVNLAICPECYKVFFSKYRLTFHIETKHSNVKIKSDPLTEVIMDSATVPTVKKKKSRGPYLRYLRANEKYECIKCKRRFKTTKTLESHVKFAHAEKKANKSEHECTLCGRKFNALRRLGNHMKIHSGNRPVFQCEECGQIYGKKTQVLEHIRNDHAEQVERHQQQQELIEVDHAQDQQFADIQAQQSTCIEGSSSTSWSPIKSPFKVPTVEQTQEAVYSLLQLTDF